MKVTAETKISELIRHNPDCIEAIATINKHFEKLRNPILRRVMAGRVTINDAAKIGNTTVEKFFEVLSTLGFYCETKPQLKEEIQKPAFLSEAKEGNTIILDVRGFIDSKIDPFLKIIKTTEEMPEGSILLLINSFEPLPLIKLLNKKGFEGYAERKDENTVYTYFKKPLKIPSEDKSKNEIKLVGFYNDEEFKSIVNIYKGMITTIDVRELEMPQPMVLILNETEKLLAGNALYVHHKKVPQYLLPELEENGFKILINNVGEGDVKLFIIK
jgi:uncharacterized protein (DUF2249 family)